MRIVVTEDTIIYYDRVGDGDYREKLYYSPKKLMDYIYSKTNTPFGKTLTAKINGQLKKMKYKPNDLYDEALKVAEAEFIVRKLDVFTDLMPKLYRDGEDITNNPWGHDKILLENKRAKEV